MADNITYTYVDSIQTRFFNSFVNLTKANPTAYPAISSVRHEYNDTSLGGSNVPVLTAVYIYDQWAFRVASLSGFSTAGGLQTPFGPV
jgi:hypothetical protein